MRIKETKIKHKAQLDFWTDFERVLAQETIEWNTIKDCAKEEEFKLYAETRLNLIQKQREQTISQRDKAEALLLKERLLEATDQEVIEEIKQKLETIRKKQQERTTWKTGMAK